MLKIWPVMMVLKVCEIYQLQLANLVWLYVGDNMGPPWQQLFTHTLQADHPEKALDKQKAGERSWVDESRFCPAAALQEHSH